MGGSFRAVSGEVVVLASCGLNGEGDFALVRVVLGDGAPFDFAGDVLDLVTVGDGIFSCSKTAGLAFNGADAPARAFCGVIVSSSSQIS